MIDFEDVEVDILETTRFEGFEEIEHPIRYRLRASGDGGEAEIEVVRSPRRLAMRDYFNDPDPRAKVAGFYGIGRSEGRIIYQGVEQVVEGRSFGSALFFSTRGD